MKSYRCRRRRHEGAMAFDGSTKPTRSRRRREEQWKIAARSWPLVPAIDSRDISRKTSPGAIERRRKMKKVSLPSGDSRSRSS